MLTHRIIRTGWTAFLSIETEFEIDSERRLLPFLTFWFLVLFILSLQYFSANIEMKERTEFSWIRIGFNCRVLTVVMKTAFHESEISCTQDQE